GCGARVPLSAVEPERIAVGVDAGLADVVELLERNERAAVVVVGRVAAGDDLAARLVVGCVEPPLARFVAVLVLPVTEYNEQSHRLPSFCLAHILAENGIHSSGICATGFRCGAAARCGRRMQASGTIRASCGRSSDRPAARRRRAAAAV